MRRQFAVGVTLMAVVGCSSSTGPNTGVTNTWGYRAPVLTDGVVTCNFGGTLVLTQHGGTVTGPYRDAFMSCTSPGGASSTLTSGAVSGTVSGSSITLILTDSTVTNTGFATAVVTSDTSTGTIDKFTMMGSARFAVTIDSLPHVLTGTWSAAVP